MTSRGMAYWAYRKPSGEQVIELNSGWSDEGEWWIGENDEFCSKWKKIRNGKAACGKILRVENNRYKFIKADGSAVDFKVVEGNPENLSEFNPKLVE